jgi:hypothetical protein
LRLSREAGDLQSALIAGITLFLSSFLPKKNIKKL